MSFTTVESLNNMSRRFERWPFVGQNCGLCELMKGRKELRYWLKPVDVKGDKRRNRVKNANKLVK